MYRWFNLHDIAPTPWKNGGGLTQEITCWPPGADMHDFQWRASVAGISTGGPFSVFPGVDRIILLLEGDGVQLRSPGQGLNHRLDQRHRPLRFSGDQPCDCELLGGRSRDFNVMVRRDAAAADLQVHHAAATGAGRHGLLFAARGAWSVQAGQDAILDAHAGICWANELLAWKAAPLEADAVLIGVTIEERA